MGQSFKFINITKRQEYSPRYSRFSEILNASTPGRLAKLLAIPEAVHGCETNSHSDSHASFEHETQQSLSWAGDRIICIGNYVNDWPESVLAAEDCKALEPPSFLYCFAAYIPSSERFLCPEYSGSGVLRNLTKKLYVRSEGIPAICNEDNELRYFHNTPIDCSPGLGHVLMCRIGWSADESMAMAWDKAETLAWGDWAGDKFDIRSYEEVKEELECGGWRDVTKEEAERITSIWEADGINELPPPTTSLRYYPPTVRYYPY